MKRAPSLRRRLTIFVGRLSTGGAERQLTLLARALDDAGWAVSVFTLYPGGAHWEALAHETRIELRALIDDGSDAPPGNAWRAGVDAVRGVWRLRRALAREPQAVLYSALYGGNLLARIATLGLPGVRLVWGLRASNMALGLRGSWARRLGAWLSPTVPMIIANSEAGRRYHKDIGFRSRRWRVIPNGIDTRRFAPRPEARAEVRGAWGLTDTQKVIGTVGRLHPMKDHRNFLRAAAALAGRREDVRFVCLGDGPAGYRAELERSAQALGLDGRIVWAGEWRDMAAAYAGFDVFTLPSAYGEGFSNALGEAMACGLPCVATDVGDARAIVGEAGIVVGPRDPEGLARAWERALELEREGIGRAARDRIQRRYSVEAFVDHTEQALGELLGHGRRAPSGHG